MSEKELEKKVGAAELKEEDTEDVTGGILFTEYIPQGDDEEGLLLHILRDGLVIDNQNDTDKDGLLG